jgi:hypothetical protein
MIPLQPGQHPVALSDRFLQCRTSQTRRLRHDREIALAALSPIWAVLRFYNEVGAVETDCGTAPRRIGPEPAAAARSLRLEHAPTVLAGMDSQIGFLKNEGNIITPELFTGAATK